MDKWQMIIMKRQQFYVGLDLLVPTSHSLNFAQFFTPLNNLADLSSPFTHEEIDNVVAHMSSDKSPGPDEFSGLFLKVCCRL
jgi:hypothetical protein